MSIVDPVSVAAAEDNHGEETRVASNLPRSSSAQRERPPKAEASAPSPLGRSVTAEDLIGIVDLGVAESFDFDGIPISPDGRFAAFQIKRAALARNVNEIRWTVIDANGGKSAIDVGSGGDPMVLVTNAGLVNGAEVPDRAQWLPDSQWIVYRAKFNGSVQIWRSRRDGAIQEQLTKNNADVTSFRLSADKRYIWFTTGKPRSVIRDAMIKEGLRGYLYDERFYSQGGALAPTVVATGTLANDTFWKVNIDSKEETLLDDVERDAYLKEGKSALADDLHARWVRRAKSTEMIAWLHDAREDRSVGINIPYTVAASRDSQGREKTICADLRCTGYFKGLWITDAEEILFLRWLNGRNYGALGLFKWNLKTNDVSEILRTDDLLEGCAYLRAHLLCSRETAITPRTIVSIALADSLTSTIYDPNPQFQSLAFGEVTPLSWKDRDGRSGFGHLIKPLGFVPGRRYPLIVVQYRSRGFLRGGVGDEYPIHAFSSNGFLVLSFHRPDNWDLYTKATDVRELSRELWAGSSDLRDALSVLEAGIDTLEEMKIVDSAKIGITGFSDGANIAGYALIHAPRRFAAASLTWTHWNPITYYLSGPKAQRDYDDWGLREPSNEQAVAAWRDMSVGMNASKIRIPLLLQVSDNELLPETQTFTAFKRAGNPIEMYVFPNEYHVKSQPMHRYSIYKRNLEWFQFWLCDVEEPAGVDPLQYVRWRSMREQRNKRVFSQSINP